jgi:hypothetical protein
MEGSGSPSKSRQTANVFDIALLIARWAAADQVQRCRQLPCHVRGPYRIRHNNESPPQEGVLAAAGRRAGL